MYIVDGYKMTAGMATFRFQSRTDGEEKEIRVNGTFLYRPDTKLWYIGPCKDFPWGVTFPKDAMVQIEEAGGNIIHD